MTRECTVLSLCITLLVGSLVQEAASSQERPSYSGFHHKFSPLSHSFLHIRKKFSASQFTNDCLKYKCTSMQYIGELCRYLLHAPPNPNDGNLSLQYAIGNGLRAEIWVPFQERFRIGRIIEFYSATEANVALLNSAGKVGSLGCVPRIIDFVYPVRSLSPSSSPDFFIGFFEYIRIRKTSLFAMRMAAVSPLTMTKLGWLCAS